MVSIWFSDPVTGIGGFYEGLKAEAEQEKERNVYRWIPKKNPATSRFVVDDFVEPNGLCFSPDEKETLCLRYRLHRRADKPVAYPARSTWISRPEKVFEQQGLCRNPQAQPSPTGAL